MNPEANSNYTDVLVALSEVEDTKKEYEQGGWKCVSDSVVDKATGRVQLQFRRKPPTESSREGLNF
jgi:hypothetical protein